MSAIGLVTIGQAPRSDVTPDIIECLPRDVNVFEVGALDRFETTSAVKHAAGPINGQPVFVTRMNDGTSITLNRKRAHELTHDRITDIEHDVDIIGLLCTGSFPTAERTVPVLKPSELLHAWLRSLSSEYATVGTLVPDKRQFEQIQQKWSDQTNILARVGSPYEGIDAVVNAATELGTAPDIVVLDCIGYTPEMKAAVQDETNASVLLARSILTKTITELL